MSGFAIVIIVVALGVILGNIMLLKHSAKMTMKQSSKPVISPETDAVKRQNESKTSAPNTKKEPHAPIDDD